MRDATCSAFSIAVARPSRSRCCGPHEHEGGEPEPDGREAQRGREGASEQERGCGCEAHRRGAEGKVVRAEEEAIVGEGEGVERLQAGETIASR